MGLEKENKFNKNTVLIFKDNLLKVKGIGKSNYSDYYKLVNIISKNHMYSLNSEAVDKELKEIDLLSILYGGENVN